MTDNKLSAKVREIFEKLLNEERETHKKIDAEIGSEYSDPFADTKVYTGKHMETKHVGGEGQNYEGYLPEIVDNNKEHNHCLLVVTYDGAGYDFLSYETDYGVGMVTTKFIKQLEESGLKVMLEHFCRWAFCVYEDN